MSSGRAAALLLALLLLAPPVVLPGPSAPLGLASGNEPLPKWGFYVYMAADNSLEDVAARDLCEMQRVGSGAELEIVVLLDQRQQGDSHAYHVERLDVSRDECRDLNEVRTDGVTETPLSQLNGSWGNELDMGSGDTLRDFLSWATVAYPVQERLLVIWDHGWGWKRVAEDHGAGSDLKVPEIETALAEYRSATGHDPLTLVGFDACLMGMVEIAYELREHALYVHGSEAYEPEQGWTYDHLLPQLQAGTTREQMVEAVVQSYVESYRNGSVSSGWSVTAAAIETAQLEPLAVQIEAYGGLLRTLLPVHGVIIEEARRDTQTFRDSGYRDLRDLTLQLDRELALPPLQQAGRNLRAALDAAIVVEDHWTQEGNRDVGNASGFTIFFPTSPYSSYATLELGQGEWAALLQSFAGWPQPHASLAAQAATHDQRNLTLNGSYSGDAARLEVWLTNADGEVVAHEEHTLGGGDGGALPEIMFAPNRSSSYRLDALLYDGDGWLQDHYITEGLEVDLQLPDLVVEISGPVIGVPNGQWLIAGSLSEGHPFGLGGTISNQGTVTASSIHLVVTDGEETWQFEWDDLVPGNSMEWLTPMELSNLTAGNYTVSAIVTSNAESDEDPASNTDIYVLQIVPLGSHSYQVTTEHESTSQFEGGEFSPTVVNITLTGDAGQGVAFVELLLDYPAEWSLQNASGYFAGADGNVFQYGIHPENSQYADPLLVPAGTASLLASFLPSLSSVAGPHEVSISLIDHNNLSAGSSTFTVNVPQYYGLQLSASERDDGEWVLFVTNTGNGPDTVVLSKTLPEGLELYLAESNLSLAPFETREVRLLGLAGADGSYEVSFSAQSVKQPELQVDLTFELQISEQQSWKVALLLGLAGAGVVVWAVAQRRLH